MDQYNSPWLGKLPLWLGSVSGLDHEAAVEDHKISPGAGVTYRPKETPRHSISPLLGPGWACPCPASSAQWPRSPWRPVARLTPGLLCTSSPVGAGSAFPFNCRAAAFQGSQNCRRQGLGVSREDSPSALIKDHSMWQHQHSTQPTSPLLWLVMQQAGRSISFIDLGRLKAQIPFAPSSAYHAHMMRPRAHHTRHWPSACVRCFDRLGVHICEPCKVHSENTN